MRFDDTVVASELSFVGDEGSVVRLPVSSDSSALSGRQLAASNGTGPVPEAAFSLNSSLRLNLEGVTLEGGAASYGVAAVVVHRGLLVMRQCAVRGVQGTRALHAIGIGGTVEVGGSTFEDNLGGAVVVAAGKVRIAHSVLVRNTAAEGGAISVTGAATTLHLVGTRIVLNVATGSGGGLHVAGGVVTLDNRTVLEDNSAPEGHTMQLLGGETQATHRSRTLD